ncbi:MAG: 50S ribosomal protein L3 [Patescibacteria group bacterium]|jgi:large subunit ribosomal protein L3
MKFIIGKKIEMTQIWQGDKIIPVTKVLAGPCSVIQVKNKEKDGYCSVQLGFEEKKAKNIAKPQLGHFKKVGINFKTVKEFRLDRIGREEKTEFSLGDKIDVGTFVIGDQIDIVGVSKGKGFQGVVKRHHFAGGRKSHGNKDQLRMPGSVSSTGVGHVFRGTKMGGRMGGDRVTVKNSEIISIDEVNNFIFIKGAVPGARNGLVLIQGLGELKIIKPSTAKVPEDEPEIKIESIETEEIKAETIKEEVK